MNIFIDIETIPAQPEDQVKAEIANTISHPTAMSKAETIQQWHNGEGKYAGVKDAAIEEAYRKTSFDGAYGEVISIAAGNGRGDVVSFCRSLGESESALLLEAFNSIARMANNQGSALQPYFIGQYVAGFDLKFLFQRCVVLGVKPPFNLPFTGRHGKDFFCTQMAWAGFGGRMSQDNLCKALGIEGKPDDIDGSKVWDFVKAGKAERVREYNEDDVRKNIQIFNRLNFINTEAEEAAA